MSGLNFTVRRTGDLLSTIANGFDDWKVEAGIFEDAGAHRNSIDNESVAEIAYKNEYGINVPQRAFMRTSFFDNRRKYQRMLSVITRRGMQGTRLQASSFNRLGREAVGDIERSISSGDWAPNAESTQLRKGGGEQMINDPLIDTGQMIDSVRYKVRR